MEVFAVVEYFCPGTVYVCKFFGRGFLATARDVKIILAVARHGQPRNSPNIVNIYSRLRLIGPHPSEDILPRLSGGPY